MSRSAPSVAVALCIGLSAWGVAATDAPAALRRLGVTKGYCVVLGDTGCRLAIDLAGRSDLTIYTQMPDARDVLAARELVDKAGLLNSTVYVERGGLGAPLHLADNLADAVITVGQGALSEDEVLRVLRPGGKALVGSREIVKPFPDGVDDWDHPYHSPNNNPRSDDRLVRWPYLTHFFSEPRYSSAPQVTLVSNGRLFELCGSIAFHEREEEWRSTLVALGGFNGTILWKRRLDPGFMVHRSTMVVASDVLYFGEGDVCWMIDTATGEALGRIRAPAGARSAGETYWKWMAVEDSVLYAVLGEPESPDPVAPYKMAHGGWPWSRLTRGYNDPGHIWGYGRIVTAFDLARRRYLWVHREREPIDTRTTCMENGRLFLFRFGSYLAALDTRNGEEIWRKTPADAPALFEAFGRYNTRQSWKTNWKTTAYLKCNEKALYFSGPQMGALAAVSSEDGSLLWHDPYDNYQLVLYDDCAYGISGQGTSVSKKFDLMTGEVLADLNVGRRACTRPTGTLDSVLFRARGGTVRHDLAAGTNSLISPMRPPCQDGVVIGNGLLYWMPWVCDCNLTMHGVACLTHAGDFDCNAEALESERLEKGEGRASSLDLSPLDWPTYRADNGRTAVTKASVITSLGRSSGPALWEFRPTAPFEPTAPVAAGGLVFISGSDGIVRALDARTGRERWKAYTGGAVKYPPSIWQGRALVGSGDGYVYCFDAAGGGLIWRFRAAPTERRIPVYGSLMSTWPAASGVLVDEGGVAYVAAGIVNYDGTHVYALDATSGAIRWQNNVTGHLNREWRSGVSVQGHLLLHRDEVYLAGGNVVSPAVYDRSSGRYCGPRPAGLSSGAPRGSELWLGPEGVVRVTGQPLYNTPEYPALPHGRRVVTFIANSGDRALAWVDGSRLMCFERDVLAGEFLAKLLPGKLGGVPGDVEPLWQADCRGSVALAVGPNAAVLAVESRAPRRSASRTRRQVVVVSLEHGGILSRRPLPAEPLRWGVAVDRDGRTVVTMRGGRVACFGRE